MRNREDVFSQCHPAILFLYFCAVIITTMLISHPAVLLCSFAGALCYQCRLTGIRKTLHRQCLYFLPAFLLVALINPAFNHYGVTVLFYLKTGPVTLEAVVYGIVLSGMLWTALLWFFNVNEVMTTDKFAYLFGRLSPALSLVLSMVFRLVPRYKKRLADIRTGQKCLGKDSSSLHLPGRIRSGAAELSMLMTWALENGIDTADSMKARGYGTAKRTSYSIFVWRRQDKWILSIAGVLFGLCLLGFCKGNAFAQYNPQILLGGFPLSAESIFVYGIWLLFVLLPAGADRIDKWIREVSA